MRLRPEEENQPQYPTLQEHKKSGKRLLRLAAGIGLGAALATSAPAGPPKVAGGIRPIPPTEKPVPEAGQSKAIKAAEKRVAELTGQLGNDKFKAREAATAQLIAMGKGAGKCKVTDKRIRGIVTASMEGCAKHKDPEVQARSRRVLTALAPKPKKVIIHRPHIAGEIRAPR